MRLLLLWTIGLARRGPASLAGATIGVGLAVALLACLGAFVDSSVKTMTRRAVASLPIDWQILLNSPSNDGAVRTAILQTDPEAVIETVAYADVPALVAETGQTVQTTGAAVVMGVGPGYQAAFPTEIVRMIGSGRGVLAAQQAAANLKVSIGDAVVIRRAAGLPPVEVKVEGIINLPDAQSLFQKAGIPSAAQQAPPDNVLVLPVETWQRLFAEQMALQPDSVRFEDHVRTVRGELPGAPEASYAWELRRANHLMLNLAGRGTVGDNLAAKLSSVRGDALYARVLFLFLGLPGLVVAALLTCGVAASGAVRRRHQQALMRTRGASVATILKLAAAEAVLVGIGGSLFGSMLAFALTKLFKIFLGVSLTNVTGWLLRATCLALLLALFAVLWPAWHEARLATVTSARRIPFPNSQPLWRRIWLDVVLLAVAALNLWWMASAGYELVFAPEGSASVSVHYGAFVGPFCLWIGAMLATLRLFGWLLQRGLPLAVKFRLPFFANRLSPLIAASLVRQRLPLSRAMGLMALAVSFAVSTAIFNATYQMQSRVDAALTNGADVTVSGIPSATLASGILRELERLPGAVAVRAMQHGYAYVGNDLQDLYGIDPKTLGDATPLANAYFAEGASSALKALTDQPDGILVSAETVMDFQLQRGDRLNVRLRSGEKGQNVSFRFIGVVREFPTAPKDSFLVANSAYFLAQAPSGLEWTILIRSKGDPSALAQRVSRVVGSITGARVSDVVSTESQISSSLTAVDLRGLTILELSFAIAFTVGASGLSLFLSFSERRRSFAILTALGAKPEHLGAFMWSEAVVVLVGGGLVGTGVGWFVAFALIKVLGGVFDPPPEGLTMPWIYLFSLIISAAALTAAGVELLLRTLFKRPVIGDLRSWI